MIDILNIFLMLISCGLGYLFPFELIIFSYAFLGPAHYLTEISWLHDRNYFTTRKSDYLFLSVCTLSLFIIAVFVQSENKTIWSQGIFFFILSSALIMAFFKSNIARSYGIFIVTILLLLFHSAKFTNLLYLFVPTLIHVYIFTGLFILFGALRSKSKWGLLSLVVFITCGLIYFFLPPLKHIVLNPDFVSQTEYFSSIAETTINLFDLSQRKEIFLSLMGFISFAYTYHYLNWFSKTKIIEWHKITKKRLLLIVSLYIAAVSIYLYNYDIGFLVLFYLSLLHVVLELPLNFKTMKGILIR